MNTMLKTLTAVALLMVILAAGAVILKNVTPERIGSPQEVRAEGSPPAPAADAEVVSTGPPPVTIKEPVNVPPDHPLQPHYRPINQPAYLQQLRQEGKTYHSKVVGRVNGRASKKDWGVRGAAHFEYLYAVDSHGKILKNDGISIVEERHFGQVHEDLFVSDYEIGIELPDRLDAVFNFLGLFGGKAAAVAKMGRTAKEVVNNVRLSVKKEWVDLARQQGMFRKLPDLDPERMASELRMFTQGTDNRLLEGKTVKITFIEGKGIERIEPIGSALSRRERDVIVRTNFVMDHYLFPDRKKEPGESWDVDGTVFGGFLDPRLDGKPDGKVTILRTPDFVSAQGEVSKRLKIVRGGILLREDTGSHTVRGELKDLRGVCVVPDAFGVVTAAHLHGYLEYKKLSRDHLLFNAEMTFAPKIHISYECTVE